MANDTIEELRKKILDTLATFRKLGPTEDKEHNARIDEMVKQVNAIQSYGLLFRHYQTLREVVTKEITGKDEAPLMVKTKNGDTVRVKNLAELDKLYEDGVL